MAPPAPDPRCSRICSFFHAGGREAEIEEVFRRILAAGAPLDQVEIACASDAHVALVWEKALRHDWPVTLGAGIAAAFTRPGRALLGLLRLDRDRLRGRATCAACCSRATVSSERARGFTAGQAARAAGPSRSRLGPRHVRLRARRLAKTLRARAPIDPDRSDDASVAKQRRQSRSDRAFAGVARGDCSCQSRRRTRAGCRCKPSSDACSRSSTAWLARKPARSTRARRSRCTTTCATCARWARSVLAAEGAPLHPRAREVAQRGAERPRPGPPLRVRWRRPAMPAVRTSSSSGSKKAASFRRPPRTRCCSTTSARRISPALRLSTDRIDEAVYAVLARLARSMRRRQRHLQLLVPRHREFRETYASWLMLQAYRAAAGERALSYPR